MVAADDDGRLDLALPHQLVETKTSTRTRAVSEPADARGQALVVHLLAGGLHPADQRLVLAKLVDDRAVGGRDVRGITRQRHPAERTLALAKERADVGGHEAGKLERALAAAEL